MKRNLVITTRIFVLTTLLFLFLLVGCRKTENLGAFEAGNPPPKPRQITGQVEEENNSDSSSKLVKEIEVNCKANSVVAVDSQEETSSTEISEDCTFELTLQTGNAYTLQFYKDNSFLANLQYEVSSELFQTSVLFISDGDSKIDLGFITFENNIAYASTSPSSQNDQDQDGTPDHEDDDDNNNGIPDEEETDCDYDGIIDFYDQDTSSCDEKPTDSETIVAIKEVLPRHGSGTNLLNIYVGTTDVIAFRTTCKIDPNTVNNTTFKVTSEFGDEISCHYNYSESQKAVYCEHSLDPFLTDTNYNAEISQIQCDDGQLIEEMGWEWQVLSLPFL